MCFCFGAEIAADWGTEFEGAAGEMQRMSTFPSRCRHCCALNPIFVAALFFKRISPQTSEPKQTSDQDDSGFRPDLCELLRKRHDTGGSVSVRGPVNRDCPREYFIFSALRKSCQAMGFPPGPKPTQNWLNRQEKGTATAVITKDN